MYSVDLYRRVRRACHVDGMRVREAALRNQIGCPWFALSVCVCNHPFSLVLYLGNQNLHPAKVLEPLRMRNLHLGKRLWMSPHGLSTA